MSYDEIGFYCSANICKLRIFFYLRLMVIIRGVLISDELFTEQFVCDLSKCKGGCCVEGDAGAPLTEAEAEKLSEAYPVIKELLPERHRAEIEENGFYTTDMDGDIATPLIDGGICAYGFYDENGIVKCSLEQKYRSGESEVPKPISCHLYPIRVLEKKNIIALNYMPRPGLCDAACTLGESLKIPVYKFVKEAIIRKFGQEFYAEMDAYAEQYITRNG